MRRLVTALVVLAGLLVAADRVGVRVAEQVLAGRLKSSAHLTSTPTVRVRGVPFLTQALQGRYDEIDVTATGLDRGGVRVASLTAALHGVHVPLGEVLSGSVTSVPVDELTAQALVTYADLAHRSGLVGLTITPAGTLVHVTARITVLGQHFTATAVSSVALKGTSIVVTARSLRALGQSSPAILNALTGRLDLRVPVGTLPYGLRLTGLQVAPEGLLLQARSGPTVLTAG